MELDWLHFVLFAIVAGLALWRRPFTQQGKLAPGPSEADRRPNYAQQLEKKRADQTDTTGDIYLFVPQKTHRNIRRLMRRAHAEQSTDIITHALVLFEIIIEKNENEIPMGFKEASGWEVFDPFKNSGNDT